jgi:arylsulfatase A-like enzyme
VRRWLHGEHPFNLHEPGESVHWIVDGNWKYIWFSGKGEEQLFHLGEDPKEEQDLSRDASSAEKLAELQAALVHALSDRPEGYVENKRLRTEVPCLTLLPKPLPPLEGF